jgi:GNAT superfamily N-acetyltransferase
VGRWQEDKVKAEKMRAVADHEVQAVMDRGTRAGLVSVMWSGTCCEIAQLFIEPKHQGRGLGRSTVDRIVHQASQRASKPVIARVLVTNPARAFWEKGRVPSGGHYG